MSLPSTTMPAAAATRKLPEKGYVLITPARNEAAFLEQTIQSVAAQSVLPLKWVIVSDGSTDGTDEIVKKYLPSHPWMELVRMPERKERHFAGKVHAFNAGKEKVREIDYRFIGSLDADITFDAGYFAFLLERLAENPKLGLVGTPFRENDQTYDYRFASVEHVSGACQFFRRECFEAINGYRPMESGGIDLVAVLSSRIKGWQVRTFPERYCVHHRKQGSGINKGLGVIIHDGKKDYQLGAHPIWEFGRGINRMRKPPYVIGGLCLLYGFFRPLLLRRKKTAPPEVVAFRRDDQMKRFRSLLSRIFRRRAGNSNPESAAEKQA